MALLESHSMALGTPAPGFTLLGIDGETWSLGSFAGARALVVVFTCNHCPYAVAAETRLVELQAHYRGQGVRVVAINPNDAERYPADDVEAMKRRADERRFNFPYLVDATQEVARAYDAVCTPDIYVFDAQLELAYHGRLDDNWQDEAKVTRRDLWEAVGAIVAGRELGFAPVPSIGCSIKWKP